jgi:hypothetical protein
LRHGDGRSLVGRVAGLILDRWPHDAPATPPIEISEPPHIDQTDEPMLSDKRDRSDAPSLGDLVRRDPIHWERPEKPGQ